MNVSALNVSNQPLAISPQRAPNNGWYANVPLASTNFTSAVVSFENGAVINTQQIQWVASNILNGGNLIIRQGDSLLLKAAPAGATNGCVMVAIGSNTVMTMTSPLTPSVYQFTTAGTYTVRGIYTSQQGVTQGGLLTVQVVGFSFTNNVPQNTKPDCAVNQSRTWNVAGVSTGVVLQVDHRIKSSTTNGVTALMLTINQNEPRYIAARLSTNGPILDVTSANGFSFFGAYQTYNTIIATNPDSSHLVETMLVLSPVLADLTMTIQINFGGVVFDDGTTTKTITGQDFDALGQYKLHFVVPSNLGAEDCHQLEIFQGSTDLGSF